MLFKILHGDASRISTDVTPYHEGYCYVTHDGYFYVDMNNERVKLNADEANKLVGYDISTVLNSSDTEIPTSKAVLDAIPEQVQPDWVETDETSPAYIRNKPAEMTEDDMLELLVELGAVDPISTIDNILYTNSSDQIYIL